MDLCDYHDYALEQASNQIWDEKAARFYQQVCWSSPFRKSARQQWKEYESRNNQMKRDKNRDKRPQIKKKDTETAKNKPKHSDDNKRNEHKGRSRNKKSDASKNVVKKSEHIPRSRRRNNDDQEWKSYVSIIQQPVKKPAEKAKQTRKAKNPRYRTKKRKIHVPERKRYNLRSQAWDKSKEPTKTPRSNYSSKVRSATARPRDNRPKTGTSVKRCPSLGVSLTESDIKCNCEDCARYGHVFSNDKLAEVFALSSPWSS